MTTDLQLDEEQDFSRKAEVVEKPSVLVRTVLSTGFVQTKKQAEYVLLGIAGVCIIATILISVVFLRGSGTPNNPYEEGQSVLLPPRGNPTSK